MKRRARRSNSEINAIHREYLALIGSNLSKTQMAKKLDISVATITKWDAGSIPLPDADPKPKDFYNNRRREGYTTDELSLQEQILVEDTFDAQSLGMTLDEFRGAYASGMMKLHLLIKNDSALGLCLRSWLDGDEQTVMDHSLF